MIELVIARYNEPLLWLLNPPFNTIPNIIYNKGDNQTFLVNEHNKGVIQLSNVGRESETYLQHIIQRYDKLADLTIFVPGSLDSNSNKYNKAFYILTNLVEASTFIGIYHSPSIRDDLYDFTLDTWACRTRTNYTNKLKLKPSTIRPFGKWNEYYFKDQKSHLAPYGGVFSVCKNDIIQHPVTRYENLISQLQVCSNPEVGHYFERSWEDVFYPLGSNTIFIKTSY
jgi:hypothetical protein